MKKIKTIHIIINKGRLTNLLPEEVEKLRTLCGQQVSVRPLDNWWNEGDLCIECYKVHKTLKGMSQAHYVED
jgi:hypothetical protein